MTNEKGRKVAVQIDLRRHGELLEDFHDVMVAEDREDEPRETLESVSDRLKKIRNVDG